MSSSEGCVIWFTGLPSSGKTTISHILVETLTRKGKAVEWLDGDVIRDLLKERGFNREDRIKHLTRMGYTASLLEKHGVTVIASFVSPYEEARQAVRGLCQRFFEVYLSTPLETCEERDVKGLYKKARAGTIISFTGVDDPFEAPPHPDITVDTRTQQPEESAIYILEEIERMMGVTGEQNG